MACWPLGLFLTAMFLSQKKLLKASISGDEAVACLAGKKLHYSAAAFVSGRLVQQDPTKMYLFQFSIQRTKRKKAGHTRHKSSASVSTLEPITEGDRERSESDAQHRASFPGPSAQAEELKEEESPEDQQRERNVEHVKRAGGFALPFFGSKNERPRARTNSRDRSHSKDEADTTDLTASPMQEPESRSTATATTPATPAAPSSTQSPSKADGNATLPSQAPSATEAQHHSAANGSHPAATANPSASHAQPSEPASSSSQLAIVAVDEDAEEKETHSDARTGQIPVHAVEGMVSAPFAIHSVCLGCVQVLQSP